MSIGPQPPLQGQDKRLAKELQSILLRINSHDNRVQALSAKSKRSRLMFIDPSDVQLGQAYTMLLGRAYYLAGEELGG